MKRGHKNYRIIWSSPETGGEETAFTGTLRQARKYAASHIGQQVVIEGRVTDFIINSAYVADENGNEAF